MTVRIITGKLEKIKLFRISALYTCRINSVLLKFNLNKCFVRLSSNGLFESEAK